MGPLISVCCTAYNHEKYIAQTLEGFLSQQTEYSFEILIHDDASPDGTADIIRDYARRYPDLIRPLYQTENQYSQNVPINETFNFPRARGKYIALCEGDDYWCHPAKLQRQIAHMESDPTCTFSFTNGYIHDENGLAPDREFLPYYEAERPWYTGESRRYELEDIARLSFIPTASFVFRTDALRNLPAEFRDKMCQHGDLRMKLYLTAAGHAWYEHMYSCVYRENVSGSAFQIWIKEKRDQLYARCATVAEMVEDVNHYSQGRAQEALFAVRDHYLRVMAHNAPSLPALTRGQVGRVYRAMPLQERLRCRLRLTLPPATAQKLAALGRRVRKGAKA